MSLCMIDSVDRLKLFEGNVKISKLPTVVIKNPPSIPIDIKTSIENDPKVPWRASWGPRFAIGQHFPSIPHSRHREASRPWHVRCHCCLAMQSPCLDRAHLKPFALKVQTHFSRVQRGSICYDQLFTEQSERMGQHQTNPNQYSLSKGIYCTDACLRDVDYCDFLTPGTSTRHLVKGCNSRISNTTTATFC